MTDLEKAAKEWVEARTAVCTSKIGSEECHQAIVRLGNAEDALARLARKLGT